MAERAGRSEPPLYPAQRQRRAVRNFLMLAPDERAQIMRVEFGWTGEWATWNREVKSMMNHVRESGQAEKFIDRFVEATADE